MNGEMLSKYFGQQDQDLYGGHVAGYGLDGYPIIGNTAPMLTQGELESLPLVANFKAAFFRMWLPEEANAYIKVQDHVANGQFFQKARRDIPVSGIAGQDGDTLKIYLEWVQVEAVCKAAGRPDAVHDHIAAAGEESANVPYEQGG